MKKNIIVSILVILITFTFNIYKVNASNELNIDHDSLKNSENEPYMSVSDIYGIELFTDEVAKTKQELSNKQQQNRKALYNSIFLSRNNAKSIRDKKFSQKIEAYNLFSQSNIQKKIKYEKDDSNVGIITVLVITFLCILTGVLTRMYYVNKRREEEKRGEYNDYTGF
ncbi:hypothetical protein [Clostridium brassicae]|uniref:Type VII secretion protein EssA n=1 Tax=Clostridium brassicae TaxID=2999072 RepID=A0ABT4D6W1_9CLOT|nr:hypothetical protein [Clostridium brassicae]MCY6958035.1 hypothetical protein [Clostridium brassicae]